VARMTAAIDAVRTETKCRKSGWPALCCCFAGATLPSQAAPRKPAPTPTPQVRTNGDEISQISAVCALLQKRFSCGKRRHQMLRGECR
jgi:hypothetical protein